MRILNHFRGHVFVPEVGSERSEIRDPLQFLGERDTMITSEIDKSGEIVSSSKPH